MNYVSFSNDFHRVSSCSDFSSRMLVKERVVFKRNVTLNDLIAADMIFTVVENNKQQAPPIRNIAITPEECGKLSTCE